MYSEEHNHCFVHFLALKHCLEHFWPPPLMKAGYGARYCPLKNIAVRYNTNPEIVRDGER